MAESHVLIVGAGPTGLVLALWLTRAGVPVRIIDKTAEPGTTSRALAIQVRTLEYYRQLGIVDAVIEEGVKIAGINVWVRGARAARVPFEDLGNGLTPYSFVLIYPQDAHERLLIGKLDALGVSVERQTELIRFDQQENGVRAAIRRGNGTEELWEAAYLVGCDGASSDIRERLAIGFPGGTYTGLFYVADVVALGPPTNGEIHVDLEEADFALVFPLKDRGHVRVVGTVREGGRSAPTFEDVRGRAIENLKLEVLGVNWFSTYRVHHRVAARFRDRRVFLLGDAAHIHSPVGGQGMNTGIGDAVNLAWKLAAVLKGGAEDSLLDTYEAERIGFARRLVATTDRIFTIVTQRGAVARFVRTRVAPFLAPRLFRLSAMRRFLFRTVSQTGIEYRQSALSAGRAGAVHGGDRLPWVETAPRENNFAPLASMEWQVHVYGEPPPGLLETCAGMGLPFHVFAWRSSMARAGFEEGALYLVRPDGHVGLADSQADTRRLRSYFDAHVSLVREKDG